ncbi:MAG: BREX-1 system adenine-specific DNA-methyltransferase PglX [Saccharofermentanales bacterium]|jgi:hypothetical protein
MDKTAIKNFAIWARNKLIADVSDKAGLLGITETEIKQPLDQSDQNVEFFDIGTTDPISITGNQIIQRAKLVDKIEQQAKQVEYKTAYNNVIEEVAYTWFNRLIAIRFMEVNDYLPTRLRVLSSERAGKIEPDLITYALEADLDYSDQERMEISELQLNNQNEELFEMLFIKQCNALNKNLPKLFEKINDYTELLINISYTDPQGVIHRLVNDIPESNFDISKQGQVEIIGWLYQYYNEERKNEVINIYKGTVKKEDIPAATQLFTTSWVVKYMVDNSLGRYWIERNRKSKLEDKLEFYVKSKADETTYINDNISPEELTILDDCMGSGHILVYAFEVLMEIYREAGYTDSNAAQLIVQKNLFGLDIDKRAYQLAYFAIMIKARSYDRRFLRRDIQPNLAAIEETNMISKFVVEGITEDFEQNSIGDYLLDAFKDAKETGSLLTIKDYNYDKFNNYLDTCVKEGALNFEEMHWHSQIQPLMKKIALQAKIMSKKYSVVCTNPPYLNKLEGNLRKFVLDNFKTFGRDLFSSFMRRNFDYCIRDGYMAFMTPFVWMFIKTYEKLREYIVDAKSIVSLIQMEYSAFEEAKVPICTFVLKNGTEKDKGLYIRLSDFKGGMDVQRDKVQEALKSEQTEYFYESCQMNFSKIPDSPIAYWASEKLIEGYFSGNLLKDTFPPRAGLTTGNNNIFMRLWHEVIYEKIGFGYNDVSETENSNHKWYPCNSGGTFRKWSTNDEYVVDWANNGAKIKNFKNDKGKLRSRPQNTQFYFKEGLTWNKISSVNFGAKFKKTGTVFDDTSRSGFANNNQKSELILGFLNSKVALSYLKVLNPTLSFTNGDLERLPILFNKQSTSKIDKLVTNNISLSKSDWDMHETSWDFSKHPLIQNVKLVSEAYDNYQAEVNQRFEQLKENEEELNRIFIDIYGLEDELTPEVSDKDVSVAKIFDEKKDIYEEIKGNQYVLTKQDVVKSLISYAVGCMFGRYSLDVEGLAYAGGDWDDSKYSTYIPDDNNILPITDEEYFSDDIVGLFTNWLTKVYGEETLEQNLEFIAEALGNRGVTNRDKIRNYFLQHFFKDHSRNYMVRGSGRRPIYWLFDSGRQHGFKALIYMHRYNQDTIGKLRINYLHRLQRIYESEIDRMQETIDRKDDTREVRNSITRQEKLVKQLQEVKDYDQKIDHLANDRIEIDLDDGVRVNYAKVQTDRFGKKWDILAKI